MNRNEVRHRVISVLLQAGGPLTFAELADQCGAAKKTIRPVLTELAAEDLVVEGKLLPDKPAPQFCWAARWETEIECRAASSREKLRALVSRTEGAPERGLDVDSPSVLAFNDYVINEYEPPRDKRFCVFLQCSVRRPFSSSPSHASMRRAISVATGYDPSKDFESCRVHVVVLASKIGPVPYELQDVHPANVGGVGVKHFDREYYARVKPILAERMAQYIIAHRASYDRMATFTESRYGEVMDEARKIAVDHCGPTADFPVLPVPDGPRITRMGKSRPRKYWEKYWIQLYLEITTWLNPAMQASAQARLRAMDIEYD